MYGKDTTATGVDINTINAIINSEGWVETSAGSYRSNGQIKTYDDVFACYVKHETVLDFLKKSNFKGTQNSTTTGLPGVVSKLPMGSQVSTLTPKINSKVPVVQTSGNLPVLADFTRYPSLAAVRSERESLVIAFDSEWIDENAMHRFLLSWQFAVIHKDELYQFVFLAKEHSPRLSLEIALGRILDELGYPSIRKDALVRYDVCTGFNDDGSSQVRTFDSWSAASTHAYDDRLCGGYGYMGYVCGEPVYDPGIYIPDLPIEERVKPRKDRDWSYFRRWMDYKVDGVTRIPVTLLCHAGKADLSALNQFTPKTRNILKYCMDVQGGVVTSMPFVIAPSSVTNVNPSQVYVLNMSIRDTMTQVPADKKRLADIGEVLGVMKISLPEHPVRYIEHMDQLLLDDPALFFRYAANDSVVTLFYGASVYGYNREMAITLTSATALVMRSIMAEYLGCAKISEFDRVYRGLEKVDHGNVWRDRHIRPNTSLEPISHTAGKVQDMAKKSYFGGYNSTSDIGYFPGLTLDYDVKNAYPTAMCLVPDIDWDNPVLDNGTVTGRRLTLDDWRLKGNIYDPTKPFVGYIRFKFPEKVKYCCIPVRVGNIPVYPRSSDGMKGVYACGPDIYLALRLGAEVYCEEGYFLRLRYRDDGSESHALSAAVVQFVRDRTSAVIDTGDKKSLLAHLLKMMINSGYGKVAQNVIEKRSWSAYSGEMEQLGLSGITNPVSAGLITSLVRCTLIAAQNQLHSLGYVVCSVTTDGFISNCPADALNSCDLYGFADVMGFARCFLTKDPDDPSDLGDPTIWEVKHAQDDLVNFTSRGNISLYCKADGYPFVYDGVEYDGVCAHNGVKSIFEKGGRADREWLYHEIVSRTKTIDYYDSVWTGFRDLADGADLIVRHPLMHKSMDFDFKRCPVFDSFRVTMVPFEGESFEMATFTTRPFETVNEYKQYRQAYKTYRKRNDGAVCLRTMGEWVTFFETVGVMMSSGAGKVYAVAGGMTYQCLVTCIKGHFAGLWTIPKLNELSRAKDQVAWLNSHNRSDRLLTTNDLKNYKRPGRAKNMLDQRVVAGLLDELISDRI